MNRKKSLKNNGLGDVLLFTLTFGALFPCQDLRAETAETKPEESEVWGVTDGFLWGLVLTEALIYGFDAFQGWPIGPPLLGPSFDPEAPDVEYLLSDDVTPVIGKPYQEETVPSSWVAYGAVGTLVGLNGLEMLRGTQDWRTYHNLSLGLSASLFTTITLTEILKRGVGRLRPDFRDRFVARGCQGALTVDPADLPCDEVADTLKEVTEKEYDYGRRSFPSGHSSSSFAVATFAALYFWDLGNDLYRRNPYAAILSWGAGATVLGLAAAVAGSRLTDNRHHLTDVLMGSILGASVATGFYVGLMRQPQVTAPGEIKAGLTMMTNDSPLFFVQTHW